MPEWEQILTELEHSTARVAAVASQDFISLAEAMNERSLAVARLGEAIAEPVAPITPGVIERIKADFENGAVLTERLLLMRAALRADVGSMAENSQLLRSLPSGSARPAARVDCRA